MPHALRRRDNPTSDRDVTSGTPLQVTDVTFRFGSFLVIIRLHRQTETGT
jgi:hypothetical protein